MKKILSLSSIIIAIILPLVITSYFTYDSVWSVLHLEKTQAIVKSCFTRTSNSGKPLNRHVPKAVSENGEVVEGYIGQPKYFLTCDGMIGETVEVYIDQQDKKNSRLATFWQMWFLPSLFFILSLAWYSLFLKKLIKRLKKT